MYAWEGNRICQKEDFKVKSVSVLYKLEITYAHCHGQNVHNFKLSKLSMTLWIANGNVEISLHDAG